MKSALLTSLILLLLIAAIAGTGSTSHLAQAAPPETKSAAPTPVEPDMHEFMEYVYQPTYKRLKVSMAAEPTDNAGWKAIKADSLILAEASNLLLHRLPEQDSSDWIKYSLQVREAGGQFYRAAQAKEFATARQHYEQMLQHCNACHKQFEDGRHILKP